MARPACIYTVDHPPAPGCRVVFFTASDIRNTEKYEKIFDELAAEEEKEVIYAKVCYVVRDYKTSHNAFVTLALVGSIIINCVRCLYAG